MNRADATIYVIDDEASIRQAMERLFRSAGLKVRCFESVEAFLEGNVPMENACVVADIRLPGLSGLQLPAELKRRGLRLPVILMTAYDTPENRAAAQQTGAAGYFRKPVDDQALLDATAWAIAHPLDARDTSNH